jgi:cytoskeletal protein CcmA (bactofilin family)
MSMWKRTDSRADEPQFPSSEPPRQSTPAAAAAPSAQTQAQAPAYSNPAPAQAAAPRSSGGAAVIGPSITVKGDVIGEEDLVVDGRVEGEIKVNRHSVTVGRNGKIKADIHAKSIQVEGEVLGNLWGDEAVVIRRTGKVQGNVTAPRVTLEDGSTFRGSIDMQPPQAAEARKPQAAAAKSEPAASSAGVPQTAVAHAASAGNQGHGNQRRERTA